jgi:hypothetical protein
MKLIFFRDVMLDRIPEESILHLYGLENLET